MTALALTCLLTALVLGALDLRAHNLAGTTPPNPLRRVASLYDRSPMGKRLAARLWRAQVRMSPSSWRLAQCLLAVPAATTLMALSVPALPAILTAASIARAGGALLLRLRRGAASAALDSAAPALARELATDLATWGSGSLAIAAASAPCSRAPTSPMAAWVLERAASRVILGGDATIALRRAVAEAVPALPPTSPAAHVAALFALHRHDTAATAAGLDRLALALEAEASARRDIRAAGSEVRLSAIAVPCLAAATLVMLLATDPPALAAALTPPLLPLLAIAATIVTVAAIGARRLVST